MPTAESALSESDPQVLIDARGSGEWIVSAPAGGGPALHVYRLGEADWLVSVVGRGDEGRGRTLHQALEALAAALPAPEGSEWWAAVPALIDEGEHARRRKPLG